MIATYYSCFGFSCYFTPDAHLDGLVGLSVWLDHGFVDQLEKKIMLQPDILLVEDNHIVQRFTVSCLKRYDCNVVLVETEKSALSKSEEKPYSLILMDIGLPDGSGWNVIESIRSKPDGLNYTAPIVIISAHVSEKSEREKCRLWKVSMLIEKPLTSDKIPALLSFIGQ